MEDGFNNKKITKNTESEELQTFVKSKNCHNILIMELRIIWKWQYLSEMITFCYLFGYFSVPRGHKGLQLKNSLIKNDILMTSNSEK